MKYLYRDVTNDQWLMLISADSIEIADEIFLSATGKNPEKAKNIAVEIRGTHEQVVT